MLKLLYPLLDDEAARQPPSGGCVLKQIPKCYDVMLAIQLPSGGCVLKRHLSNPV